MSKTVDELIIGEQISINRLAMKTSRESYPWLDILANIKQGYAQEVKINQTTCIRAIKRLEAENRIMKDEFIVRTRMIDGKRHTFIMRFKMSGLSKVAEIK